MAIATRAQRLLLNALDDGAAVTVAGWNLTDLHAAADPALEPKAGQVALRFAGVAGEGGGKGDFDLSRPPADELSALGVWVHVKPDANVESVGFQVVDAEGESLSCLVPVDWTGWKWVEVDLRKADTFRPAYEQSDKNGRLDLPLRSIHFVWFAKAAGSTSVGVDGLAAVRPVLPADAGRGAGFELTGAAWGEPGQPCKSQTLLTNYTDAPLRVELRYSVQRNPDLYDKPSPDPVLGRDHAQGCKSWVELNGMRTDDNSLTDDDEYTNYQLPYRNEGYEEAFQFVDLGTVCTVAGLAYQAGDANWAFDVDIAGSGDGGVYAPVTGLQGLDFHGKWGRQNVAVAEPFRTRFLRLRFYKKSGTAEKFAFPSALYVYGGAGGDVADLPKVGETVEEKTLSLTVGPKNFALAPLGTTVALAPGSYFLGARVSGPTGVQVQTAPYFVLPVAGFKTGPASRFGMDVAEPKYIPMLQRLGVGWVRFDNVKWMMFSPAKDRFLFDGTLAPWNVPFDDYIRQYREAGMSFLPYIFQTPEWATSAPAGVEKNRMHYPPRDLADYARAVYEVAARYGSTKHPPSDLHTPDGKSGLGELTTYELWNESNLSDPAWGFFVGPFDRYLDLFRAGAEGAKRGDPRARVTTAGFAGLSMDVVDRLHTYRYADGKTPLDFADVLNVHFYSGRQEPEYATDDPNVYREGLKPEQVRTYADDLTALADWRDELKPAMPIWITETGNDVGGPIGRSERFQAAKIPRTLMIAFANGVEKVFVYRETGSTPAQHAGAGVMREDGSLRPVFFTLATLIRQLDGVMETRVPRLQVPNSKAWLYRWKRGAESVVTAWTPEGTEPLGLDLGRCTVTDAFGNVSERQVGRDFQLGIFPVYITRVGNPAPLDALAREAAEREATRRGRNAFARTAPAYLFDFGSREYVGTRRVGGTTRAFTPVLAADLFDAAKGYGFAAKVGGKDVVRPWIHNDLETDAVMLWEPAVFRVDVKPGTYQMEFKGEGFAEGSELVIDGGQPGGLRLTLPTEKQPSTRPVTTKLTVAAGQSLTFQLPGSGSVQWLTLVQVPPQAL